MQHNKFREFKPNHQFLQGNLCNSIEKDNLLRGTNVKLMMGKLYCQVMKVSHRVNGITLVEEC